VFAFATTASAPFQNVGLGRLAKKSRHAAPMCGLFAMVELKGCFYKR